MEMSCVFVSLCFQAPLCPAAVEPVDSARQLRQTLSKVLLQLQRERDNGWLSVTPLSSSPIISSPISWSCMGVGVSRRTKFDGHVPS